MLFFGILGAISLLYFVIICFYTGPGLAFNWFWAFGGVAGLFLAAFWQRLPLKLQKGIWGIFFIVMAVCVFLEAQILYYANQKPQKNADYLIVLGCKVQGTRVSRSLRYRLEAAFTYAEENPETKIIVSGGQGFGEDISEAEAMYRWLTDKGIEQERILMEAHSTNTYENMKFSRSLIEKEAAVEEARVVVVSNGFHICRALKLGQKQGFEEFQGLGAKTDPVMAVSYYIREAFALLKDSIVGNI